MELNYRNLNTIHFINKNLTYVLLNISIYNLEC